MVPGRLPVILFCCFLSRFCDMYLSSLDLDGTSEFCCILAPYPVFKYPEYPSTEHSGSVPAATSQPAGGHLARQPAAPLLLPHPAPSLPGQRGRRRALTPGSSWSWPLLYPRVRGGVLDPVQPKRAPGVFSVYSRDREEKARSASPSPFSLSPFPRCNRQILLPSRAGPRRSTWG